MPTERPLKPLWEVGELPFHIGTRPEPSNGGLPDLLPFGVGVDEQTGALAQLPRPEVSAALEDAYRFGSQIGTPLSPSGLGRPGLDDFLAFLTHAAGGSFEGRTVLEIGSGAGAVLEGLAERGAQVVGVEPDEEHAASSRFDVIPEPFTKSLFGDRRFDMIVNYGVLEHIEQPLGFVQDQLALLQPEGVIAFSVPDCAGYLAQGDLSMLVHEHWSYFDEDSLAALAAAAGATVVDSRPAQAAGARYSIWRLGASNGARPSGSAQPFVDRAQRSLDRLRDYLTAKREASRSLGVFAPARFFNYQQILKDECPDLRYFDDDANHQGLYYPPFPIRVESRESLRDNPVDELLIMSWTFGRRLAEELAQDPALKGTELTTIEDLLRS
jgi:SAM-dependent methyltransferase